jgi:hypothetical protein
VGPTVSAGARPRSGGPAGTRRVPSSARRHGPAAGLTDSKGAAVGVATSRGSGGDGRVTAGHRVHA